MNKTPSQNFFDLCERVGRRTPEWTQGPGSNISEKDGDVLWIKASGQRLDQVHRPDSTSGMKGVAAVDLASLRARFSKIDEKDSACETQYAALVKGSSLADLSAERPSMETGFHALLRRRFVVHFHAILALAMAEEASADSKFFQDFACKVLAKSVRVVVLPALMPGFTLSKQIAEASDADIFLLKNHGVVLHSADATCLNDWQILESAFAVQHGIDESQFRSVKHDSGELRLFFPDSAVFYDRLRRITIKTGGDKATLREDAWTSDRDAAEIWWATQMILSFPKTPEELPESVASQVANLPTEIFRRSRHES